MSTPEEYRRQIWEEVRRQREEEEWWRNWQNHPLDTETVAKYLDYLNSGKQRAREELRAWTVKSALIEEVYSPEEERSSLLWQIRTGNARRRIWVDNPRLATLVNSMYLVSTETLPGRELIYFIGTPMLGRGVDLSWDPQGQVPWLTDSKNKRTQALKRFLVIKKGSLSFMDVYSDTFSTELGVERLADEVEASLALKILQETESGDVQIVGRVSIPEAEQRKRPFHPYRASVEKPRKAASAEDDKRVQDVKEWVESSQELLIRAVANILDAKGDKNRDLMGDYWSEAIRAYAAALYSKFGYTDNFRLVEIPDEVAGVALRFSVGGKDLFLQPFYREGEVYRILVEDIENLELYYPRRQATPADIRELLDRSYAKNLRLEDGWLPTYDFDFYSSFGLHEEITVEGKRTPVASYLMAVITGETSPDRPVTKAEKKPQEAELDTFMDERVDDYLERGAGDWPYEKRIARFREVIGELASKAERGEMILEIGELMIDFHKASSFPKKDKIREQIYRILIDRDFPNVWIQLRVLESLIATK